MTPAALAILGATILATSFIAGVFGMAGGMILLGVLLVYFDVATGMVVFSLLQFSANVSRVTLWRRFILWPVFWQFVAGGAVAFALMRLIAFIPDKATVYLLLGGMPFCVEALPKKWRPNIEWRYVPYASGFLTTIVLLISGSGGLFLDVFFQKSRLDRKTTVATKAICHTFGHVFRIGYFAPLGGVAGATLPQWAIAGAIALAVGGTALAPLVLNRMTDQNFRQWTRAIILAVGASYLLRAAWLFWHGA
jgi:uncharacterized membrane protein YfcA